MTHISLSFSYCSVFVAFFSTRWFCISKQNVYIEARISIYRYQNYFSCYICSLVTPSRNSIANLANILLCTSFSAEPPGAADLFSNTRLHYEHYIPIVQTKKPMLPHMNDPNVNTLRTSKQTKNAGTHTQRMLQLLRSSASYSDKTYRGNFHGEISPPEIKAQRKPKK